jgi:hypothetical protein
MEVSSARLDFAARAVAFRAEDEPAILAAYMAIKIMAVMGAF